MTHTTDTDPSVLHRIDDVLEEEPEHAQSTRDAAPESDHSGQDGIQAVLLTTYSAHDVELDPINPRGAIASYLDTSDSDCVRLRHVSSLDMWVAASNYQNRRPNQSATGVLRRILNDIINGQYAAPDVCRDHARAVMAARTAAPVIHGATVIVGADNAGYPTRLPEAFITWWNQNVELAAFLSLFQGLSYPIDVIDPQNDDDVPRS